MIKLENVTHFYNKNTPEEIVALNNISTSIGESEFVAILGHNGSGKSTLAKLLNALIIPSEGAVLIDEISTRTQASLWSIRSRVGMVFQNPDNQLVAPTVEEELAFGPENLGVPRDEILKRIDFALNLAELEKYRHSAPHLLSGGQKQKVAIASVLAMYPKYLVLDEPTAMLDPLGQNEVMRTIGKLNEEKGMTIILVTQNMKEAALARRVIVMNHGKIVINDNPRNVFKNIQHMTDLGLDAPPMTKLACRLNKKGLGIPEDILTVEEMVHALINIRARV